MRKMILELSNFIHFVGIAFGLGGSTLAAIVMRKAGKDKDLSLAAKVIPDIAKLIWVGLILAIVSGIVLTAVTPWPMNLSMLAAKHFLVIVLVIVGLYFWFGMVPKIKKIKPGKVPKDFMKETKYMKFFSTIGLVCWYLVTLLSVFV